jgi:hypothetical protein
LELSRGKSGQKTDVERLYRSVGAWFTPADFACRDDLEIAFRICGASYVDARCPLASADSEAVRCDHEFLDKRYENGF